MTSCDAEKAYADGSYKLISDDELEQAANSSLNVSGVNEINVDRVRRVGDLLREELRLRKDRRKEQYAVGGASAPEPSAVAERSDDQGRESWTEARLLNMISNQIEEGVQLDYKAAGALKREDRERIEITKDVSALANAAGGTLIYGISEFRDKSLQHLPEKLDPISRKAISREWLEHIVATIRPRIPNVRILPVQLSSSQDSVAYVVEVPQGVTAHQATDYRYYRRYNFESVPMLDHEVRDVMNRKSHPTIQVKARLVFFTNPIRNEGMNGNLIFDIENHSDVFARFIALVVEAPLRITDKVAIFEDGILLDDTCTGWLLRYSNHGGVPLFPKIKVSSQFKFKFGRWKRETPPTNEIMKIRYTAYADAMPRVQGEIDPSSLA